MKSLWGLKTKPRTALNHTAETPQGEDCYYWCCSARWTLPPFSATITALWTELGNGNVARERTGCCPCFFVSWLVRCSVVSSSFAIPWTTTHQAPLFMGFPRQEYWSELLFPFLGVLPNPGMEPTSPTLAGGFFTTEPPRKLLLCVISKLVEVVKYFIVLPSTLDSGSQAALRQWEAPAWLWVEKTKIQPTQQKQTNTYPSQPWTHGGLWRSSISTKQEFKNTEFQLLFQIFRIKICFLISCWGNLYELQSFRSVALHYTTCCSF